MSLYVYVSDNEMIDAASVIHMLRDGDKVTLHLVSGYVIEHTGPYAIKVFNSIRKSQVAENDAYEKNNHLLNVHHSALLEDEPESDLGDSSDFDGFPRG